MEMATHIRGICQVILASVVLWQNSASNADGVRYLAAYEKIKYHLKELNSGLREYSSFGIHSIHKRSVLNHDEVIYNSLKAFCHELNPQIDGTSSPSTITPDKTAPNSTSTSMSEENISSMTIPAPTKTNVPVNTAISTWPHVFPVKIRGQREGDNVWLLFDLMHTGPVTVYRLYSFDTQKLFVDYPQELSTSKAFLPVISKVRIKVDASACGDLALRANDYSASIGFTLRGKSSYHVTTQIDLCKFDHFENMSIYNENRWIKKPEKIITKSVPLPYLKITSSDPGDQIMLEKGQDVQIELEIHTKGYSQISFQTQLWDRQIKGKIMKSYATLRVDSGKIKTYPMQGDVSATEKDLLNVEVLNQTSHQSPWEENSFNDTVDELKNEGDNIVKARIRLTVATANGRRSGKLLLSYFRFQYNEGNLLDTLSAVREISLKIPHKSLIFPRNYVEITAPEEGRALECDNNGNRHYTKMGKNCTVFCHAFGTDIKDIFISNSQSSQPQAVDSLSFILDGNSYAFAMLNMGPASEKIDGAYRCTAIASNGRKKRKDIKLFTSLFTEVLNATLTEIQNGTAIVTCVAFGKQPLNVSVLASKDDGTTERLDNKTINTRNYAVQGNLANLTVWLSADQLKFPTTFAECRASGERGENGYALNVDLYNMPKINRMPNVSTIHDYANGTALITCAANGVKPIEIWLTYGGNSEYFRIDNNPDNIRWTSETNDGSTLHLLISVDFFSYRMSWLGCRAGNRFGDDWHDFYLPDFIRFP